METEENVNSSILIAKIISGSGLFVISVICGIIPFKLAKMLKWTEISYGKDGKQQKNLTVNLLLSFGGGVLIATTFLHLLPEINSTIAWLVEEKMIPEVAFSLGEFFMLSGFFIIFLIEEIVHNYLHRHQRKLIREAEKKDKIDLESGSSSEFLRNVAARNSVLSFTSQLSKTSLEDMSMNKEKEIHSSATKHTHNHGHSHILPLPHSPGEDSLVKNLRGLLIVLALSIHELFEGFAVGLEKDATGVYYMFAAVSAHKYVISFCIGVELMVQKTKLTLAIVYIIVYSAVSAIGIAIGAILTTGSNGDNLQVPNVILQGLATGTLLYVIFFEILAKDRTGLLSYLSVLGGFLIMFGLQYIAGVSEGH